MDYKQIEAFVNVVKFSSFSKAADASFLTQPTISTHISTLEKELDTVLLIRGNKEITTTSSGKIFFEYAIDMINSREKAFSALKEFKNNLNGVLDIFASSIPGQYLLPKIITDFQFKNSNVKIYMEQSDSQEVIDKIISRYGEVGFTGKKPTDELNYVLVKKDKMVLITPNNDKYRELNRRTIYMNEFVSDKFIWREQGSATRSEFEDAIRNRGINVESINDVAKMNSLEAIKNSVSAGLGVSIVSQLAVPEHEKKYLVFEIGDFMLEREFYMIYNNPRRLSPIAESFVKFVKEYMGVN